MFLGDTYRLTRMMVNGRKLAMILASMHWTLVEFVSPVVATSDHPVVLWPGGASRVPQSTPLGVGILQCSEIRLPLSPRHVVLMTWSDDADDEPARVRGTRSHAASVNAFTVKQADRQWFHLPGTSPPVATGRLVPIAADLVDGYTAAVAASSRRRTAVTAHLETLADRDIRADDDFSILRVGGRRSAEGSSEWTADK